MLRVYKNIEQFDHTKGTFFNWVYTIVRNASLTLVRDKKTVASMELFTDDLQDTAGYNPFLEKEWHDIFSFLAKLPPTTRAVCSLYYMEGFSIKEMSIALDMKEGTVKWHLNESRKQLKIIVQPNLKK